jgi:uncharacterized membrane protein YGL010W
MQDRHTRTQREWIAAYSESHRNPVNKLLHLFGIPMIASAVVLFPFAFFYPALWPWFLALFFVGWTLQFIGHAIEGKPPEFFKDWRFLFVGLRWWFAKVLGKA